MVFLFYICSIKLNKLVMDKLTFKQRLIVVALATAMGLMVVTIHYLQNN